ncbi:MAG: hypothetical protein KDA44_19210 [Planctomycetales bacterium]|nr:hypothetical protein [Planctomycetales bacterium]
MTYADHVRPIFQQHCFACHSQDDKNSDLALDDFGSVMTGGAGGEVVAAGDPGSSRLWALVTHADSPEMPPGGDKLPDDQLAVIRAWIEGGLLENAGSKPRKGPAIAMEVKQTADNRPAGEPAMPHGVLCEPLVAPAQPAAVVAIAASPWAPLTAIGGPRQVALYHSESGQLLGILPYGEGDPLVVRFSRDGSRLLVAGGRQGAFGNAAIYDVAAGVRVATVGEEVDAVLAADLSPDQSLLAVGGPKKVVRVYRVADGSVAYEIRKHTDWVTAIEFSPDGKLLATADRAGGVYLWDAAAGNEAASLSGHSEHVTAVSWRADSHMLATASEDDTVRLWTPQGQQVKNWNAHGGGVLSVEFHRNGQLLTAGRDRKVKVWDGGGKHLGDLVETPDLALAARFTHAGKSAVAGDWLGGCRVVSVEDHQVLRQLPPNPPRLATRLELAQQAAGSARAAHEKATAALTAAQVELAAADAALAQQDQQRKQANEVATATNQERVAAAKRLADGVAAWRQATEAAAAQADHLVEAEQAAWQARAALADWQAHGQPGGDAAGAEVQAAVDRAAAAVETAKSAATKADEELAVALAAKDKSNQQAAAAAEAHQAAAAEASARRQAEPAADRAAATAKLSQCEQDASSAALVLAAAESELARAAELLEAYRTAEARFAQEIDEASATAAQLAAVAADQEAASAQRRRQLAERQEAAAAVAAQLAELKKNLQAARDAAKQAQAEAAAAEQASHDAELRKAAAAEVAELAKAKAAEFKKAEELRATGN